MGAEKVFNRLSSDDEDLNEPEDERLRELDDSVSEAINDKQDDIEEVFSQYQRRQQQLKVKAMEDAQRVVLRQMMSDVLDIIDEQKRDLRHEFMTELKSREGKLKSSMDDIRSKTSKNRKKLKEVDEKTSEEIETLEQNVSEAEDNIHGRIDEVKEELEADVEKNAEAVEQRDEELEDLKETVEQKEEKLMDKLDSAESKLNERIDSNRSLFRKKSDTLTDKIDEATLKIESMEEMDSPEGLRKEVESLSNKVEKVERDSRASGSADIDTDEVVEKVRERLEKEELSELEQEDSGPSALKPGDVDESMEGREIKLEGNLEFRKKANGFNFYKMSDKGDHVIVRSKDRIPSGRHVFDGTVKKIKGNLIVET